MAAKIKKGDKVVVLDRPRQGPTGEVVQVMPKEDRALVRGVNMVKRHQTPDAEPGGRHHLQGGADPPVEHRHRRPEGRQADPRRLQGSGRRAQGALRQALGRGDRWLSERMRRATRRACASTTTRSCARSSIEEFGYKNPMQVPAIDKIVLNMGVGEATADTKKASVAAADLALIAGQKPVITKARKAISHVQGAREHADRRQGHPAQDADVRVPRPSGEHRAAARPRLPRPEPEVVRRPRQLRLGHQGAHRVPRDQLRQGRAGLGHGHHRLHDGQDRRRGPRAARAFNFPFRQ